MTGGARQQARKAPGEASTGRFRRVSHAYSSWVTPIRVIYRKYDGSLHWNMELGRLGADEHGTWLGAPAGTRARRGSEEPVTRETLILGNEAALRAFALGMVALAVALVVLRAR